MRNRPPAVRGPTCMTGSRCSWAAWWRRWCCSTAWPGSPGWTAAPWTLGYTPKQGDIVVLNKTPVLLTGWTEPRAIVKRVIATGGQTVDIDYMAGLVYVDGQPLDEPYLPEEMYLPGPTMQQTHWEVPEGSIFVMGDNRNHSTDSRDIQLGPIDTDYILGRAVLALWPSERFGAV